MDGKLIGFILLLLFPLSSCVVSQGGGKIYRLYDYSKILRDDSDSLATKLSFTAVRYKKNDFVLIGEDFTHKGKLIDSIPTLLESKFNQTIVYNGKKKKARFLVFFDEKQDVLFVLCYIGRYGIGFYRSKKGDALAF